jgi:LIVCS family branched-chain amino acid:cation transporter
MLHPFIPMMSLLVFALIFSLATFLLAYRPTKLIDILGRYIMPIKLFFVGLLIVLGFVKGSELAVSTMSNADLLGKSMFDGYGTLDLLGTIFFGSVYLNIFKKNLGVRETYDVKELAKKGLIASLVGGSILAVVYTGMIFLGAYQGAGLEGLDQAAILSAISIRVVGIYGGLFGALALMVACLATMIALSTVIADYINTELTRNRLGFIPSLVIILAGGIIFSLLDLKQLMVYSNIAGFILYPVLITLTLCNVCYKIFGFKPVKIPVLIVFLATLFFHFDGVQATKDLLYPDHEYVVTEMVIKDVPEQDIVEDEIVEDEIIEDDGASQA